MTEDIFNVYIDEAGDEGFTVKDGKWVSTQWFILGALVVRESNDLMLSRCVNQIKQTIGWKKNNPLHFTKMTHDQKRFTIKCMKDTGYFKCCYVAVDKQAFNRPTMLSSTKGYLYNYCTRYLLERVTWLVKGYNGRANLVFENRGITLYDDLQQYILKLIRDDDTQIKKGVIMDLKTLNKGQSKNLQLADSAISALFKALEKNKLGMTEPSYIQQLSPFIYNRNKNYHGYGMKFFPNTIIHPKITNEYDWLKLFTDGKSVV